MKEWIEVKSEIRTVAKNKEIAESLLKTVDIRLEALITYLEKFYKNFDEYEIRFIDDLRKIRNKIDYKGFTVNPEYLKRNNLEIKNILSKLKKLIKGKLK